MFEINEFKLFKKGFGGLQAHVIALYTDPNGRTIIEKGMRERSIPVGMTLQAEIAKLKYYFLILTGHWIQPFNDRFDTETMAPKVPGEGESYDGPWTVLLDIWNKTYITGAKITDDRQFLIKGYLEIIDKKPVNISSPQISMTDDYIFYEDTIALLNNIAQGIAEYFTVGHILEQPRNTLKELAGYEEEAINELTDQEIEEQLIEILESRGAIMIKETDTPKPELPEAVKELIEEDDKDNEPVPEPESNQGDGKAVPANAPPDPEEDVPQTPGPSDLPPGQPAESEADPDLTQAAPSMGIEIPEDNVADTVSPTIPGHVPAGVQEEEEPIAPESPLNELEYSKNLGGMEINESNEPKTGNW